MLRLRLYRRADEHGSQVLEKLSDNTVVLGHVGSRYAFRSAFGVALGPDAARSARSGFWACSRAGIRSRVHAAFTGVPDPRISPTASGWPIAPRARDLGYVWSASDRRTNWPAVTCRATLVAERDGRVVGFVDWYLIDFLGRTPCLGDGGSDGLRFDVAGREQRLHPRALDLIVQEGAKFAWTLRTILLPVHALADRLDHDPRKLSLIMRADGY